MFKLLTPLQKVTILGQMGCEYRTLKKLDHGGNARVPNAIPRTCAHARAAAKKPVLITYWAPRSEKVRVQPDGNFRISAAEKFRTGSRYIHPVPSHL
jgi:hypothetical protein